MALDLTNKTVLIVDDVRDMRTSLRAIVKSLGADSVHEAKNGAEAIDSLQSHDVDLVLCDYYLGEGRDGQQVFEEAKEFGMIAPTTAFLMITADNTTDVVMAVVDHSPDGYLIKPLNKSVLELRLEKILYKKRVFKDIDSCMHGGDYAKAAAICDIMIERHPELRFDLMKMKSEALLASGKNDKVNELCAELLAEREIPWATLAMGRAQYQAGNVELARELIQKTIEQNDSLMDAHDWLVKIERDCGEMLAAQRAMESAVKLSPKSIGRQQVLADIATDNGDHETARKAFRAAIDLGTHSIYSRVADQVGLVNAVGEIDGPAEALKMLDGLSNSKRAANASQNGPTWQLELSCGQMLLASEQASKAKGAIENAYKGYCEEQRDSADPVAIALAKSCYRVGMLTEAKELMNQIVKENHDREDVITAVRAMYNELGMEGLGDDLIDTARRAVVEINNRGVSLAKEGKLDDAIAMLTQASEELPGNLTISLNVLQAVVSQIRFEGLTEEREQLTDVYIDRAARIDPKNAKLAKVKQKLLVLSQEPEQRMQA